MLYFLDQTFGVHAVFAYVSFLNLKMSNTTLCMLLIVGMGILVMIWIKCLSKCCFRRGTMIVRVLSISLDGCYWQCTSIRALESRLKPVRGSKDVEGTGYDLEAGRRVLYFGLDESLHTTKNQVLLDALCDAIDEDYEIKVHYSKYLWPLPWESAEFCRIDKISALKTKVA